MSWRSIKKEYESEYRVIDENLATVAKVIDEPKALLIAASPELFNALLWAERRLRVDQKKAGKYVLNIVQNALAKAEGKESQ